MNDKRTLLVVGGTSGIGRATALAGARQGYAVVISGRSREKGEAVLSGLPGDGHLFIPADIGQSGEVQRLVTEMVERCGRLDAACNAAATDEGIGTLLADVEETDFDRQMSVNLKGIWLCMKYQIQQMLRQGEGSIVNISSVNGLGGVRGGSIYAAAKSGILGLTKSAAQEYAGAGIRVNALCAGAFDTPMLQGVFEKASPGNAQAVEEIYKSLIPLNRIGRPEEAAECVLWLLSAQAAYVTGHTMIIDGGMSSSFR